MIETERRGWLGLGSRGECEDCRSLDDLREQQIPESTTTYLILSYRTQDPIVIILPDPPPIVDFFHNILRGHTCAKR